MKFIRFLFRLIPGLVFIFSGFVKALDPLGTAYKLTDYFTAFHLGFLQPLSLALAILLSSFELIIGIALIMDYCRQVVAWALLLFMSFFTVLTFVLALTNPVSDCGCFGDALILTNWQTFLKNIILFPFVILVFMIRKQKQENRFYIKQGFVLFLFFILAAGFSVLNYLHLPLIDFRPYKEGTLIREKMEVPVDAPVDQYETTLFYQNKISGETKEFDIENYPKDTASWTFIDAESKLISKGYEPPIHDFAVSDPQGLDITQDILDNPEPVIMLISYDLTKADQEVLRKANLWYELAEYSSDLTFIAVTASATSTVKNLKEDVNIEYPFYTADEIMLKTVIRSNPGFVLIREGVILGKWAGRDFPSVNEVNREWPEKIGQIRNEINQFIGDEQEEEMIPEILHPVIITGPKITSVLLSGVVKQVNKKVVLIYILSLLVIISLSLINRMPRSELKRRRR